MKYNFDKVIDRSNNYSAKYDELESKFGRKDLCSMWVADMDFESPKPVIDAIKARAEQGIFGYTSRTDSYYDAFTGWYKRRYDWDIKRELIANSPGVVTSLSVLMKEFTKAGDKIIVQTPVYYPFLNVVKDNGRQLVLNPLKNIDGDYVMDYEDLKKKIDNKVKYLILCNPHNPVGRVWTKKELIKLGNICIENNITVISDEIHGELVYGENKYTPFASISEEFRKNSIICLSATKTFNIAGLQDSFVVFPNKKTYEQFKGFLDILGIKRNNCFSLVAVETAFRHGEEWLKQLLEYLEGNCRFIIDYCKKNIPSIKPNKPQGTYLVWLDCRDLGLDDESLNDFMINKAKIALDEGRWFGEEGKGYTRINIACPRTTLEEGLTRIGKAVEEYL
ncbi:cystathione beta-lyase [Anaerovirgula multivorans]|uniref:cysteine-S-conjugate beta-lyase n=1 Tax=Anaerovirgula multivorans TaxID=312168 RepID=A0A239GGD8_9FIRM|nr:MalY/PatB family protein [Anaerovirgula multivorans]SNS67808.1 cystathione beta-lyase [Anaerovirgula multivorans]